MVFLHIHFVLWYREGFYSSQPSLLPKKTEIMGQVTNLKKWFINVLSHNGKWSCSYRASILPQIYTIVLVHSGCFSVSTYALSVLVHSDAAVLVFPHTCTCTQTVSESILKLISMYSEMWYLEFPGNLSTKGTEQRTEVKNFVTVAFSYSSGHFVLSWTDSLFFF